MAEAGAKVLNAQAVEFAKEKGIAIYARATQGPAPGSDPALSMTARWFGRAHREVPGAVRRGRRGGDLLVLDGSAAAADVLALLAERRVPGKQLHVFEGQHDRGHSAGEPPRRGPVEEEALQTPDWADAPAWLAASLAT